MLLSVARLQRRCLTSHATCRQYSDGPRHPPFQVLFFGNDEFSIDVLAALHEAKEIWSDLWVCTTTPMNVGRRRKDLYIPPLKAWADGLGLPTYGLSSRDRGRWKGPGPFGSHILPVQNRIPWMSFLDIPEKAIDPKIRRTRLLVTASFGQILPHKVLDRFNEDRRLNVHPSLLPALRGAAPIPWAIMSGMTKTGVSVIGMTKTDVDDGPIWHQKTMQIAQGDTYATLGKKLGMEGGLSLVHVMRQMLDDEAASRPQVGDPTWADKIHSGKTQIQWSEHSAVHLDRMHRGFGHYSPLWTFVPVWKEKPVSRTIQFTSLELSSKHTTRLTEPGQAWVDDSGDLQVRCADGAELTVHRVLVQNRKETSAKAWWNGMPRKDVVQFGDVVTLLDS